MPVSDNPGLSEIGPASGRVGRGAQIDVDRF